MALPHLSCLIPLQPACSLPTLLLIAPSPALTLIWWILQCPCHHESDVPRWDVLSPSLHNAALCYEAWLEFLSTFLVPCGTLDMHQHCLCQDWVDHGWQSDFSTCGKEHSLFVLLFSLPFDNHVHQALTTQSSLTLAKATEACICFNAVHKIHLADAESATTAKSQTSGISFMTANLWVTLVVCLTWPIKCDSHFRAHMCLSQLIAWLPLCNPTQKHLLEVGPAIRDPKLVCTFLFTPHSLQN